MALIPALRFVVVGTGRCGTTYVSQLLQRSGIPIDHEVVFTQTGPQDPGNLEGDASWMAVPFLGDFPGSVLHLVREPLAVIDSLLDLGLFAGNFGDEIHRPWRRFLEQNFELGGDPVVDAMRFYVQWNERCEAHADLRIRIEDQCPLIPAFIDALYPGKGVVVAGHLPRISTRLNSREERRVPRTRAVGLLREDLPKGSDCDALLAMAERYGYSPLTAA
jgi:hypothetical protein